MLTYFPSFYEGELLYSVIARYHIHSGNINFRETTKDLFGKAKTYIIPDLTTDLEVLYSKTQHFGISDVNNWIDKHTLYNYYTNFNSINTKSIVRKRMLVNNESTGIHCVTGQLASTVKEPTYFRNCPDCTKEDMRIYGETYWRAYHQLPSVMVCLKHSVLLQDSSILFRQMSSSIAIATEENYAKMDYNHLSNIDIAWLHTFAEESYKILVKEYSFEPTKLEEIYHYLLKDKGYMSIKGKVDQKRLARDFLSTYGTNVLNLMQSTPGDNDGNCWLRSITRKHRSSFHSIRHLLLIHFLGESVDTIYQYINKTYNPFDEEPYLCLNPAADHYLSPVIKNIKIKNCHRTNKIIGTFYCSCGFIYTRKGPDTTPEDRVKLGRVIEFGDVWKKKLHCMIHEEKRSYQACSSFFKVGINTISKYALNVECIDREKNRKKETVNQIKSQWLFLMKHNPGISKTELRKMEPAIYMRLYRDDRKWLDNNSPIGIRKVKICNRVNWKERDLNILSEVKDAVKALLTCDKPVRLTIGSIGKAINRLSLLEKNSEKLPLTMEFILIHLESVTDFQKRRIQWVVEQLENDELVEWKIKRLAGLNPKFYKDMEGEIERFISNNSMGY
ncbi:Tn7-like transposition protein D [Virgibacillus soli]|nr:Tn7-like transposition protein D [Virgibacillus soli]